MSLVRLFMYVVVHPSGCLPTRARETCVLWKTDASSSGSGFRLQCRLTSNQCLITHHYLSSAQRSLGGRDDNTLSMLPSQIEYHGMTIPPTLGRIGSDVWSAANEQPTTPLRFETGGSGVTTIAIVVSSLRQLSPAKTQLLHGEPLQLIFMLRHLEQAARRGSAPGAFTVLMTSSCVNLTCGTATAASTLLLSPQVHLVDHSDQGRAMRDGILPHKFPNGH
eukprot:2699010-Rhodomonas_salina.2